jgi:hypothetical protein
MFSLVAQLGEDRDGDPRCSELVDPLFRADGSTCCTNRKLLAQPLWAGPSSFQGMLVIGQKSTRIHDFLIQGECKAV